MASCEHDNKSVSDIDEEDRNQIVEFSKFLFEYFEVAEKWKSVKDFIDEHPMASLFLIVTMAMCAVPVLLFILFIMGSVALSILGVFLFEGTVIAIGTFFLGGALFFVGLFSMGFSIFLIFGYYGIQTCRKILTRIQDKLPYFPFINDDTVPSGRENDD